MTMPHNKPLLICLALLSLTACSEDPEPADTENRLNMEQAKQMAEDLKQKMLEGSSEMKDVLSETGEKVGEQAQIAADKAKDIDLKLSDETKEKLAGVTEKVLDGTAAAAEAVARKAKEMKASVAEDNDE